MTHPQMVAQRVGLIELRLLSSPFLSRDDCALVVELAKIARQCVRQPEPTRPAIRPITYLLAAP